MKKKLLAIVMSASMVLSFMPSIAFAASEYTADAKECWDWTVGSNTAVLKYATKNTDKITLNEKATVKYYTDSACTTEHSPCATQSDKETVYAKLTTVDSINGGQISYVWPVSVKVAFPAHDFETVTKKDATCTTEGYLQDAKYCKTCKTYFNVDTGASLDKSAVVAPKTAHKAVVDAADTTVWKTDATKVYLRQGATVKCEDCGKSFTTLDSYEATKGAGTVARAATCTKTGISGTEVTDVTDAVDNLVVTYVKDPKETAKTPHTKSSSTVSFVWDKKTPAAKAYTGGCTVCGEGAVEVTCKVEKKAGETDPTCGNSKYVKYTATAYTGSGDVIGTPEEHSYYVTSAKHNYVAVAEKPATCKDAGTKAHYQCSVCKAKFEKDDDGEYTSVNDVALTINARHEATATYTWPSDKDIKDVYKTLTVDDNFLNNKKVTLGNLKVKVASVKCKNCGFELKKDVTKELPVYINGKEFAKLNEGKALCDDSIVLPLYVEATEETAASNDMYTTDNGKYESLKYYLASATKNVTGVATAHDTAGSTPEFVWDAADSKDIKCSITFKKCKNEKIKYDSVDKKYAFDDKNKCDNVSASQPATVTGKVTVEPTCTKNGEGLYKATYTDPATKKTYTSEEKKIVLAKTAHKTSIIAAVAPTVFIEGKTAGVKCEVCGEILNAPEAVAKAKYAAPTVKAGKKLATVTVKSTKGAVKYKISYKKAGGKYVTKTVKAGKKVTIKKLAKGKKYTFKAVAINADGVKAYSAVKTVKIK